MVVIVIVIMPMIIVVVEQWWQAVAARSSERVETLVVARFQSRRPGGRVEPERGHHQPDSVSRGPSRNRWRTRDQRSLVRYAGAWKQGSARHEFGVNATGAPHVHRGGVVGRVGWLVEQEFGRSVAPRTGVPGVRPAVQQVLGAAEVAQLEHARDRVQQKVAGLHVPMAQPRRLVHVPQAPEHLIRVQLAVTRARRPAVRGQSSDRAVQVGRRQFHNQVQPTGAVVFACGAVPPCTAHIKLYSLWRQNDRDF